LHTVNRRTIGLLLLVLLHAALASGCAATTPFDRTFVASELEQRAGHALPAAPSGAEPALPPQVSLDDGLTEAEAVAIALWNNTEFHATLAELGIARADLVEAGLLPNPILSLVFPGGTGAHEGTLSIPIQILQRHTRIRIAEIDAERVANDLLQTGLSLVRDVRVAHAELGLADARAALRGRESALLGDIAEIAEDQLRAGSISALEQDRVQADALTAVAAHQESVRLVTAARRRLAELLGLTDLTAMRLAAAESISVGPLPELDALVALALASRPDLRAAELAIEAAGESARLERQQVYDFIALIDLQEDKGADLETGPGVQMDLPIFTRNQGGKLRTTTQIEQAMLRYTAARRRIVLDVSATYADFSAALSAAQAWQDDIVPRLEASLQGVQRELEIGRSSELLVLRGEQRLLAARVAGAEATAELGRAAANLAHSVGQKMAPTQP
jgi:cobalt-zinc-cadmium efflux system outer membrane protein